MSSARNKRLVVSALMLALALVLPYFTGGIPAIGNLLLPMHLPVLLCGFVCGWKWGLLVGFVTPLLRSVLFGMPPMVPTALAMAFEMAGYGAVAGLLYQRLRPGRGRVYVALIGAMLAGRAVWGLASWLIYALLTQSRFALAAFWMGGFVNAWPGMALQVVLVPLIVIALERARLIPLKEK